MKVVLVTDTHFGARSDSLILTLTSRGSMMTSFSHLYRRKG